MVHLTKKFKIELLRFGLGRTDRYSEERTAETVANRKKIEMSYIGG